MLFESLLGVVEHVLNVTALWCVLEVQEYFLSRKLVSTCWVLWLGWSGVVSETWGLSILAGDWWGEEDGKSNHQVSGIASVNQGFDVPQRHLLVNYDPILILNREVGLNEYKEFRINHDISHAHLLFDPLVAQNELHIDWRQLIGASFFPWMNRSSFSGNWVDIYTRISRINDSFISNFGNWISTQDIHQLSQSQEYLDLVAQNFNWLLWIEQLRWNSAVYLTIVDAG